MGLTRELCETINAFDYDSLGDECVFRVKQAIQDGIAVALAGCREPQIRISVEHFQFLGGNPQASIWGLGAKASVVQAAYVNAAATHVLDFEPMSTPPTHCVSPTVPVALALAEILPVTGKQVIAAVAKGTEIQGRMQLAGGMLVASKLKFHPTGTAGVLGSAVVASDLLGLGVEGMQHSIAFAASRLGGLLANIGSMVKCTHSATGAASGLDAALLVSRGFRANPDALEASKGIIETLYPEQFDRDILLSFGKPFRIADPGFAIKLFPSQYGTHYAITAGLDIHAQAGGAERIRQVRIVSPVMKYIDRPQPATGLDGKFSLQYGAAAAMLDGKVGIASFTDERRHRADMVGLLAKITLTQDPSIVGDFHHMHVAIEADLIDGSRISAICRGPKGSWGVPLDPAAHRDKLLDCMSRALPPAQVDELLGLFERIEALDAGGVKKLIALIASATQQKE